MLVVLNNNCNFNLDEYLDYQNKLKNFNFKNDIVLCHESVAVNIKSIDKLTKTDLMVRNQEMLPIAKSRYAQVAEKYMNYRFR